MSKKVLEPENIAELKGKIQTTKANLVATKIKLDAAREAFPAAQARAIEAVLRARDLQYCQQQGVLESTNPDLLAACEQAESARLQVLQLRRDLTEAEGASTNLQAWLAEEEAALAAEEHTHRVRQHRPELAAEFDEAQAEYARLTDYNDPQVLRALDTPHHNGLVLRAAERLRLAQANFEGAQL
jgi:hypothetical protein